MFIFYFLCEIVICEICVGMPFYADGYTTHIIHIEKQLVNYKSLGLGLGLGFMFNIIICLISFI